jgi:hypothetical protein
MTADVATELTPRAIHIASIVLSGRRLTAKHSDTIWPPPRRGRHGLSIPVLRAAVVDYKASRAAALARRLAEAGAADAAFELLRLGRNDEITASALVELAPHLSTDHVLLIEQRLSNPRLQSLDVKLRSGHTLLSDDSARAYLYSRLAPSIARVGHVDRAREYARAVDEQWRVAAYLGIAEATSDATRQRALLDALTTALGPRGVLQREQFAPAARALARESKAAAAAWPIVLDWARANSRHHAVEALASHAPVAAVVGGESLCDEVFGAIDSVLRWWP